MLQALLSVYLETFPTARKLPGKHVKQLTGNQDISYAQHSLL